MRLLMISGDRQVVLGEQGPFYAMQEEFSKHFERIDVLVPKPAGPVRVRTIHERVHFHAADVGRAGMVAFLLRKGRELIRAQAPDLIVSHDYGWFYNGIAAARLSRASGVPYVSEIHHVPGYPRAADLRERFDYWVARTYVRWARSRAVAFRVVNAGEMPALLERWGVPRDKIVVLPSLYIDLELFSPAPGGSQSNAQQDVLFVGRLVNNKGLGRLVQALALLQGRGRPVSALLLGRGPLRASTQAAVEAAGLAHLVRFIDWVETPRDLAELYRRSRLVVCASTCEGGPRVTVEGMSCGIPAVSTPVGVMGELLADGRAGRLVDFSAEGLADGLSAVLENETRRQALGQRARELAQGYERKAVLARYAEGLKGLASRGRA